MSEAADPYEDRHNYLDAAPCPFRAPTSSPNPLEHFSARVSQNEQSCMGGPSNPLVCYSIIGAMYMEQKIGLCLRKYPDPSPSEATHPRGRVGKAYPRRGWLFVLRATFTRLFDNQVLLSITLGAPT